MRRRLSSLAFAALVVAPLSLIACGDDDDDDRPGGGAGRSGSGGSSAGQGDGGSKAGTGGSKAGSGGTGATDGGTGGTDGGTGAMGGDPDPGGAGSGGMPTTCDISGEGLDREPLPQEIDEDLTLENDRVWVIDGIVKIRDGATLTIPPCTRLEGTADPAGVLVALRGGRLVAEGTADEPIVFTTMEPVGDRAAGQWGGVVLLGRAPITRPGDAPESIYEGLTDEDFTYGGDDPEDDSGSLRFVRIEFGGWEIFPEKEVNGLSMAGVGSGTTLSHIMVSNTSDDCFEWWGGASRGDYLIANNCGDDMFDGDEGWSGGGRYWLGRRAAWAIDSDDPNGFELDSINADLVSPRTAFSFQDVTLCGTGEGSGRANPEFGMVLRELVTGEIDNLALLGFEHGIDTRNAFETGDVVISNSKVWELLHDLGAPDPTDNDGGFDDASIFTDDDSNEFDPDPAPFTLEECLEPSGPAAAVIESRIGAFPTQASVNAWRLDGLWVDWSEE